MSILPATFLLKIIMCCSLKKSVWFCFVLWCINHCRLFHAESIFIHKTILFQTIQFSISIVFCLHTVNVKTVLFQTIQFSISIQFSSIWPIDKTLSGVTTPDQTGPGSDGNEGLLQILQSASITGTSLSDCLVSYPGHSLGGGGFTPLQRSNWCIL